MITIGSNNIGVKSHAWDKMFVDKYLTEDKLYQLRNQFSLSFVIKLGQFRYKLCQKYMGLGLIMA